MNPDIIKSFLRSAYKIRIINTNTKRTNFPPVEIVRAENYF